MNNPCLNCITYPVCQNKSMQEKWDMCHWYNVYMQSKGWTQYPNGQLLCIRSNASTTYVTIGG